MNIPIHLGLLLSGSGFSTMELEMEAHVSDTSREVHDLMIKGHREMAPWRKLEIACQLTCSVRQMALARIRAKYEYISEREQLLRLASLWLDGDTMRRVFNWDPDEKGF